MLGRCADTHVREIAEVLHIIIEGDNRIGAPSAALSEKEVEFLRTELKWRYTICTRMLILSMSFYFFIQGEY